MDGEALAAFVRMSAFVARHGDMGVNPKEALSFQRLLNDLADEYDLDRGQLRRDAQAILDQGRDWTLDQAASQFMRDAKYLGKRYAGRARLLRLHTDFTAICNADKKITPGEQIILDELRSIWDLPAPIL